MLYYTVLYSIVLRCVVLWFIVLWFIVLCCVVLFDILLYWVVLYCPVFIFFGKLFVSSQLKISTKVAKFIKYIDKDRRFTSIGNIFRVDKISIYNDYKSTQALLSRKQ